MVGPVHLRLPLSPEDVSRLKAGDLVSMSGTLVTGRDRMHRYLHDQRPLKEEVPFDLSGTVIYHCGPVMKKMNGGYKALSAGPTTSMRMEAYEAEVIRAYGIRGVMGKGGMGKKTLQALKDNGCVYLHTIGGAAVYLADRIKGSLGVWKLEEFGATEAMWLLEVEEFPAIVTMDAKGNDMHREIEEMSYKTFAGLIGK